MKTMLGQHHQPNLR